MVGTLTYETARLQFKMAAAELRNGGATFALTKIKLATDPAERATLCAEAEKVLMATGAVNPMYFYTNPYMLKSNVSNVFMLSTGDDIWTYATVE